MIKAIAHDEDGKPLVVLGLSKMNLVKLRIDLLLALGWSPIDILHSASQYTGVTIITATQEERKWN